ncbi:unnamed protein product [Dibothriocephalus latus]|uniref:Uncharacterized protein n=1 Tax=Dibothriocephalus latus TaxID=60516 RepID=A0A3P7NGZ8_DIBLA|nr:unnamed protein product [Dibothriocephalus latus]
MYLDSITFYWKVRLVSSGLRLKSKTEEYLHPETLQEHDNLNRLADQLPGLVSALYRKFTFGSISYLSHAWLAHLSFRIMYLTCLPHSSNKLHPRCELAYPGSCLDNSITPFACGGQYGAADRQHPAAKKSPEPPNAMESSAKPPGEVSVSNRTAATRSDI